MRNFLKFGTITAAALTAAGMASAATLEDVRAAGELACGVSEGVPGFSNPNSDGDWVGLDADICRAVAAAVLGDANAVRFVPLASKQKVLAVSSGQVDLTSRTTTWTMKRDSAEGVDFTAVVYYDGQGFMVSSEAGIKSAKEMDGATVCVTTGTTTELNLADFGRANGLSLEPVVFEGKREAVDAYASGRCDALTTDLSQLAAFRSSFADPSAHKILPEVISKEPLAPLVAHGDNQWKDIVTWVIYGLISAEELGVTQANVAEMAASSQDPNIQRMVGASGDTGGFIGLESSWMADAITAVGNYGEIYERNLTATLGLERGLNELWTKGGILYAMPIR
ncbi:amino acid ABC transporter substrate-binding protein [Lentibacter sp. XHP0401]|jgi:general L-amino acid transport system substrate-binding protein|uniref:amino acid ABC transporter substrate-binding protein n=1 Tax=Lentibacter sp. XHP0401 TaxID=2984334 RepID=UPI0021E9219D|nr:amino acid ABC transporter substrate-binding protein [Lentibacter sp. XHP0401]MCV2894263.1 amino acid ABC transporter substrate-binding protein [Lentibacter sp. XHP0401]